MSKQGDKTEPKGAAGVPTVAGLLRDLADRERQLRDLTEQSLGFLEDLAETRRLNADRDQLAERLGQLEHLLGDARRRLRHAGGSVQSALDEQSPPASAALEVVFWGSDAHGDAVASLAVRGSVPVMWVGRPDAVPSQGKAASKSKAEAPAVASDLQVIAHRDAQTQAQCWNLGMAATTAEFVLMLGPGMQLREEPKFPTVEVPTNVALLCPRIERGERSELGCEESHLLRLHARELPSGVLASLTAVPWACAQAFVVRRAAFERIGLFDEGLLGPTALLDFTLRAQRANFVVLGAPALAVSACAEPTEIAETERQDDEQRLLVLAAHRPQDVGKALAAAPLLWQMDASALPGYLAQILARLPAAADVAEHRVILEQIALGLVQHSLPATQVCTRVRDACIALLQGLVAAELPARDEAMAALQRAQLQHFKEPIGAFAVLMEHVSLNRRTVATAAQVLSQTRAEKTEIDIDRHAQLARAERAEGARASAQTQLDQVTLWLRETQARLAESTEKQSHLEVQLREAQRQLEGTRREYRELEAEFVATDGGLRELRDEVGAMAKVVGLASTEHGEQLVGRLAQLHEESVRFAETLRVAGAPDAAALLDSMDALSQRVQAAEQTIAERDRWIALLLAEVSKRRLFARKLLPQEQAIIDQVAQKP